MDGNSVWQRSDGNFQRFINVRQFGTPDWQAPNQTAMWDWDWDLLQICSAHGQKLTFGSKMVKVYFPLLTSALSRCFTTGTPKSHGLRVGEDVLYIYIYTGFSWSALHTIYVYI